MKARGDGSSGGGGRAGGHTVLGNKFTLPYGLGRGFKDSPHLSSTSSTTANTLFQGTFVLVALVTNLLSLPPSTRFRPCHRVPVCLPILSLHLRTPHFQVFLFFALSAPALFVDNVCRPSCAFTHPLSSPRNYYKRPSRPWCGSPFLNAERGILLQVCAKSLFISTWNAQGK